jgi:hypothetical protein
VLTGTNRWRYLSNRTTFVSRKGGLHSNGVPRASVYFGWSRYYYGMNLSKAPSCGTCDASAWYVACIITSRSLPTSIHAEKRIRIQKKKKAVSTKPREEFQSAYLFTYHYIHHCCRLSRDPHPTPAAISVILIIAYPLSLNNEDPEYTIARAMLMRHHACLSQIT